MDFEISPGQVKSLQKSGDTFTLLDVRESWEYEASRIEGSKHIPMGDVPTRAHQELDPDDHIVVMCHHGVRSLTVTNWLRQQGYEKVQSMRGGIDGWDSAAEAFNVTLELVRRGYTEEQIGKMWSGNLLRVWGEVEKVSQKLQKE